MQPPVLCNCSYRWLMPWTTWRSYFVSAGVMDRSLVWRDHFAWRVYRLCLGMTPTGGLIQKETYFFTFDIFTKKPLAIFMSSGGWLITHTLPSMLSCTVGTCPQMFRCSLDLSLLCWMKRWSPCPDQSVQVPSWLHIPQFRVKFKLFSYLTIYSVICISDLEIIGFIEIGDISSPPVISRHLVLPIAVNKG